MSHSQGLELMGGLAITLVAALVGGFAARALRLPVLVGYLLAGVAIGPHTPGFIADEKMVLSLANIGVALLMFAVGVQFSLKELHHVRRTAIVGGGVQIVGMVLVGIPLGHLLGWGAYGGLFLGCVMALSSTAVMMRVLEERGELGTAHGTVMMGILLVQDLAVIPMAILLPTFAGPDSGGGSLAAIAQALAKAVFFLAVTVFLAARLVPAVLARITSVGSRELFLLSLVCLCLLAGGAAEALGLGMALGAFMAGIVVSGSDYAHESLSQVRPLRDVFASVFFVSIGMLLDPMDVVRHWATVGAVLAAIVVIKGGLLALLLSLLGWRGRTAIAAALGLAQIGEFSFVLTTMGRSQGLISGEMVGAIYASALITIMAAPFLLSAAPSVHQASLRFPWVARLLRGRAEAHETAWLGDGACPPDHAIIVGSGRIGRYVSDAFLDRGVPHVVIDYDTVAVEHRRNRGVAVIYGDATSDDVLEAARPACARLAVVSLSEHSSTERVVRLLRGLAPNLPIVARVHSGGGMGRMRQAGADAVIHAEFEAGVEMIRESMARLPVPSAQVDAYLAALRAERYDTEDMT